MVVVQQFWLILKQLDKNINDNDDQFFIKWGGD